METADYMTVEITPGEGVVIALHREGQSLFYPLGEEAAKAIAAPYQKYCVLHFINSEGIDRLKSQVGVKSDS